MSTQMQDMPEHVRAAQAMLDEEQAAEQAEQVQNEQPETPAEAVAEATPAETPTETPEAPAEAPVEAPAQGPSEVEALKAELETLKAEHDRLKAAHETLRGKEYAEVPRVTAQNRELRQRITALEAEIAEARAERANPKADESDDVELTDDERETGPEVLSLAKKVATRIAERIVDQRIKSLKPQPAAPENDDSEFFSTLEALVPDWQRTNADHGFREWLMQRDPLTSEVRNRLLQKAYLERDALTASNFFTVYSEKKPVPPKVQPQEPPKPQQPPKPSVAAQVAPRTVNAGPPKPKGKVWKMADWEAEHVKLTREYYTPERAKEIERELVAADREGRIVD